MKMIGITEKSAEHSSIFILCSFQGKKITIFLIIKKISVYNLTDFLIIFSVILQT